MPRNYEKTFFLDLLTDDDIERAQEIAAAEADDMSVSSFLSNCVNNSIAKNPEAREYVEEMKANALDNLTSIIAVPLHELCNDDDDAIAVSNKYWHNEKFGLDTEL